MGLYLYEDALINGSPRGDSAVLYAYGIYLAHGGTPDRFMELSIEDIKILMMTYSADQQRQTADLVRAISKMFGDTDGSQ